MRVLIAGFGNVLRTDDAFGVEVVRRLADIALPEGVHVHETGIGGMTMVQELHDGYDALVIVDAVDRGRPPGTIMFIEPEVVEVDSLTPAERHEVMADIHLTTPAKAMMMARAMGVLPDLRILVGCQPEEPEEVGLEMTATMTAAVPVAVEEIVRHVTELVGAGPA